MTSLEPVPAQTPGGRQVVRIALACLALLTVAGALMWYRFGAGIFIGVLTTLQGCF
jgi:hypothetical protein